jgi:hypothetical protein
MVVDKPELEVENILVNHILGWGRGRVHEYFIQWKDNPDEENSWEKYESLWKYEDMIQEFDRGHYGSQVKRKLSG